MAIFTPDNEPYVGIESLKALDDLIVAALAANEKIAPNTHRAEKSPLQMAGCQLIPAGFSLALSIRELIRQAYLYGALVLGRPLAERAVTIMYLHRFPEKQALWDSGWQPGKRPTLGSMFNEIGGDDWPGIGRTMTQQMNSLTHGDPESAQWNLIEMSSGSFGHAVSKITNRPDIAEKVAAETSCWLGVLVSQALTIFPIEEPTSDTQTDERNGDNGN